jgi:hypothetical protein
MSLRRLIRALARKPTIFVESSVSPGFLFISDWKEINNNNNNKNKIK